MRLKTNENWNSRNYKYYLSFIHTPANNIFVTRVKKKQLFDLYT